MIFINKIPYSQHELIKRVRRAERELMTKEIKRSGISYEVAANENARPRAHEQEWGRGRVSPFVNLITKFTTGASFKDVQPQVRTRFIKLRPRLPPLSPIETRREPRLRYYFTLIIRHKRILKAHVTAAYYYAQIARLTIAPCSLASRLSNV